MLHYLHRMDYYFVLPEKLHEKNRGFQVFLTKYFYSFSKEGVKNLGFHIVLIYHISYTIEKLTTQ